MILHNQLPQKINRSWESWPSSMPLEGSSLLDICFFVLKKHRANIHRCVMFYSFLIKVSLFWWKRKTETSRSSLDSPFA